MTALRLCLVFALLAVPAFAQTAATRATVYTEIDTLFADSGADPITPAQLRQSLKNITASSYNPMTDGSAERAVTLNALNYGATGDGTTDDTAALQSAIDAATALGGAIVSLPGGSYKLTSNLAMKSGVILQGVGIDTVLVANGNFAAVKYTGSSGSRITNTGVRNLRITGSATVTDTANTLISITQYADRAWFDRLWLEGAGYDGINILGDATNVWVTQCYVYNCQDDGINPGGNASASTGTRDVFILGNTIVSVVGDGIHISDLSENTTCLGNIVRGCDTGIGIYKSNNNLIQSNQVIGCAYGIQTKAGPNNTNRIVGNYIDGSTTRGISLTMADTDFVIDGNTITTSTGEAIYISNSADRCTIRGNTIDAATYGVRVASGTDSLIAGNRIRTVSVDGVLVTAGVRASITDNHISVVTGYGINLAAANSSRVSGNRINTAARGIYSQAPECQITNNFIESCTDYGIVSSGAGAGSNLIAFNVIDTITNSTAAILTSSPSNVVMGNTVRDATASLNVTTGNGTGTRAIFNDFGSGTVVMNSDGDNAVSVASGIFAFTGAVTGDSFNKVTVTAPATGSTLTIADGKTLTASNTLTLTATDGSTLAVGTGGTLGTAAYTTASAYATSAQGTKADNVGAVNGLVKSNGSASFSAASAGTDYVVPAGNVATATALATPRAIYGNNFDGSAALTQIIASTYGGTGNGFAKFSGPTTSEKTFTLPDAPATILTSNDAVTVAQGGTGATTLTANNVILGNGTSAVQFVAPGDSGNVLTSNGTTWTSAAPTGGSGDVATDAIWDAKGDLAGGTGANTAARLAVGTNGQALVADSAEATGLKWTSTLSPTDIELGHASDTTLARSSAGIISVEGVAVPTISSTDTLSNKTLASPTVTGTMTLGGASAATIDYPNAGDTNYTATGGGKIIYAPGVRFNGGIFDSAGADGAAGDVLMSDGSDVVWRGRQPMVFSYVTSATNHTASTTAGFFESNGNRRQTKIDLTNFTQARIVVSVGSTAPVADTQVYVRYYTATSTTWADWLPMGTSSADVVVLLPATSNACTAGAWTDLVAGAKGDVFIVVGCVAPSGSTAISATSITIQFR